MEQPIRGKIYSVSDRHREASIECADGQRFILQPEHFDFELLCKLMEEQATVYAMGMKAAGLPLLMRATVKFFDWSDAIT